MSSVTAYIGVGSNVDAPRHVRSALHALRERFGSVVCSSVYRSRAVGFEGDDFLNLVVALQTDLPLQGLIDELRAIEAANGRSRSDARFGPRTLDLDLLLYGDLVTRDPVVLPRSEITRYGFVLGPLAEIAGDLRHPVTGHNYAELWQAFDRGAQPLERLSDW